jgi:hypothetical protein
MSLFGSKWVRRWGWRRVVLGLGCVGVAAGALCWWRGTFGLRAMAQHAATPQVQAEAPAPAPAPSSDYTQRVVGYLHNNVAVTREQLGEYLIARYGAEKLELFMNKLIIDEACKAHGVEVTAAEIEASLADDLKGLNVDKKGFVSQVLKAYHMNLYEWKEDVVRPRLQMAKLCANRVKPTDQDFQDAYEAYHGPKVEVQMIFWPRDQEKFATEQYPKIRDSAEEFDKMAKMQPNGRLAATDGHLPQPIGRHTTGNDELEKEIFKLQPGEITSLIQAPGGYVVAKCIKRVPAETSVSMASVKPQLEREILRKKTQAEIPVVFAELRKAANARTMLKDPNKQEDLASAVQAELSALNNVKPGTAHPGPAMNAAAPGH